MSKLNVLLAKTDHLAGMFKKGLEEYVKFFKAHQGAFRGERKTYDPRTGTQDMPGERNSKLVITTTGEKLDYLKSSSKDYIDALFSQEKTNSIGIAKVKLVVDGQDFGELSSLELLRLKSLLELGTFKDVYENLPVRNDDEIWTPSSDTNYSGRGIFESVKRVGITKTITKESYILPDPNVTKDSGSKYTPQVATKDTVVELGDYTYQKFTGETSHVERAYILGRRSKLLVAVIEALKTANEVEAVPSELTSDKIFGYLHTGTI